MDRGLGSTILSPITSGAHNHIKLQACENSVGRFSLFSSTNVTGFHIRVSEQDCHYLLRSTGLLRAQ